MKDIKVKCVIDTVGYNEKPKDKFDQVMITKRMCIDVAKEYSIDEIKTKILKGCTIRPAFCGSKEYEWNSQKMFWIDIDEVLSIENAIIRCKQINVIPTLVYTSFSHTEEHHKFRMIFVFDNEVTQYTKAIKIQLSLMKLFPDCDPQCKNLNRFYYAGKRIVFESDNMLKLDTFNIDYIEADYDRKIENLQKNMFKDDINGFSDVLASNTVKSSAKRKGVHEKENIIISLLSCTPKTPSTQNDIYNIKAIGDKNTEYLKSIYGNHEKIIFETNQEFINYITTQIDLVELLGIKYSASFRCIFHNDNSPSASIFKNDNGQYIYKCNSNNCGLSYNIIGVIERIGKFKSRPRTYQFIKDIFSLEVSETDWQREQRDILLENLKVLNNGELKDNCLQANKNINGIKHYLEKLHIIALNNIYNEKLTDDDGNVTFFASVDYIAKQMGISSNSLNKISQRLVVLAYHKLINKLDDNEIPEQYLRKSVHLSIDAGNKRKSHINWFTIPSYTVNNFPDIEKNGQLWKDNAYTMKGVSREMFYRGEGLDVANKLYPQYKKVTETIDGQRKIVDRTTTKASDLRTNNIVSAIHCLISESGYATENAILETLKEEYSYITTLVQLKKSFKEILDTYDLKRIRATKIMKEQYGITSSGYPFIIVKN